MEEIKIENRIYEGEFYDIQTVELTSVKGGASVHFQIMKCKDTGKLTAPSVDVFSHSSMDNKLPKNFELKIYSDDKMTKKTRNNETYSVISIKVKEASQ